MHAPLRDDRILFVTRFLFGLFAFVVLPFFLGLTFWPEHTDVNFSWPLAPRMSAMLFGSLYFAVVYSFLRVAFARAWHHVALVLWATLPVLAMLGVVTLMHWEKFTSDPLRLGVWITAYLVFPPFLTLLLALNLRRDPKVPDTDDVEVPLGVRRLSLVFGFAFGLVGLGLLVAPTFMATIWPWPIKKLAAQGIGCLFLAPFAVQLVALSESRWSAIRLVTESAILWFTAIWVAVFRCFDEFDTSRPFTWVFLAFLAAEWVLATWLYVGLEARRRAQRNDIRTARA